MIQLKEETNETVNFGTIKPLNKATVAMRATLLVLIAITIYFFVTMDNQGVDVLKSITNTLGNLKMIFLEPFSQRITLWEAFCDVVITLGLAF